MTNYCAGHRSSSLLLVTMVAMVGCSSGKKSGGSFDAKNAPYGSSTPATVTHSVIQHGSTTADAVTQVVGTKTIDGQTFKRLSCTNTKDPSSGVEWWIDEKPGESVTLAGWDGHSTLAKGIVPPGVVTLDKPLTVSLRPILNTPQQATSSATIQVQGETTARQGQATFNYTLVDDNAAIETSMGTIYGCKHFSGSATATSELLPAALQGQTATGDIWYHPSYGIVAFLSPLLGLGMEMADSSDCSAPDAEGYAVVRKVGMVDSAHPFSLDTYGDCMQEFDADKDQHAQMLLELRWADDAKAKAGSVDSLGPMLRTEFGTVFGTFPATPTSSQVSVFHPEENGQGFNYTYVFVSQAAKNETTNGIAYHIAVSVDSGASAIRATGRIYYKKYGNSSPRDAAPVSNPRDAAPVSIGDTALADARPDGSVGSDAVDAAADSRADVTAGDSVDVVEAQKPSTGNLIVNGTAEQGTGSADGAPVATPGWTTTGQATAVQYGVSGYPAPTDPGPTNRGLNFFCGGASDATSTLTQTISLSAFAVAIDTGKTSFALEGYLGGFAGQDDNAVLSVSFLNASGTSVATASIGPVLATDRASATGMLPRSTDAVVPAGARSAVVTLTMTRTAGTANDGYADNLSLVLLGVGDVSTGDAGDARPDTSGSSAQEAYLLKMESVQGVSFNPPVATTFTLTGQAYITRIWTYHYNATIGTKSPTVSFKDTTTGTVYGPWAMTGYKSINSALGVSKTDPGNVKGPPDNYWMAHPETTVPAGTYQVIDSDPTTWAYTSDLGNRGSAWVYGWYTSGAPDAGASDAAKDGVADVLQTAGSNLIVNGSAEQMTGSPDGTPVATPGWTVAGNATAVQYGCSNCVTLTDPGPPSRGLNFFAGGLADATSTLTQTLSLASYAASIDTGTMTFVLQGYLGGYAGQDDNAVLSVSFLNASGTSIGTASIGPVLSSDRGGVNALLLRSASGTVPVGARSVAATLTMTRMSGTANDGWADDLSLVLSGISLL